MLYRHDLITFDGSTVLEYGDREVVVERISNGTFTGELQWLPAGLYLGHGGTLIGATIEYEGPTDHHGHAVASGKDYRTLGLTDFRIRHFKEQEAGCVPA